MAYPCLSVKRPQNACVISDRSSYPDYKDRVGATKEGEEEEDEDIGAVAGAAEQGDNPFQLVLPSGW